MRRGMQALMAAGSAKQVIVEWSPLRLEVSLVRAKRIIRGEAASGEIVAQAAAAETFGASLAMLRKPLAELVGALGATGARARLLYRAPDTAVSLHSCPRSAGGGKARRAAMLALGDLATFPLAENPSAIDAVATDARAASGETAQSHSIVAAELDQCAEHLAGWLEEAGLVVDALIPADAVYMAAAVDDAMMRSAKQAALSLYVGDESVVIAGAARQRLRFARQLAIGLDTLASALARDRRAAEGVEARLSLDAALAALREQGIPEPSATASSGGDRTMLPLLQPILQRWILDVRQSVRFGLGGDERPVVRLLGPGAAIPRLAEVIATECALTIDESAAPAGESVTPDLLRLGRAPVGVLPHRLDRQREQRRLRKACWAGAACAAGVIAAIGAQVRLDLDIERERLDRLQTQLQQLGPQLTMRQRAEEIRSTLAPLEGRVGELAGAAPNWAPILAAVADATSDSIQVEQLNLTAPRGAAAAVLISGSVTGATDAGAIKSLRAYREALEAIPAIEHAAIGSTNLLQEGDGASRHFELRLRLLDLPWLQLVEAPATGDEEGAP